MMDEILIDLWTEVNELDMLQLSSSDDKIDWVPCEMVHFPVVSQDFICFIIDINQLLFLITRPIS